MPSRTEDDEEKEMRMQIDLIDVQQQMKDAGLVYREPDKKNPKYKDAEELLKYSFIIDMRGREFVDTEGNDESS